VSPALNRTVDLERYEAEVGSAVADWNVAGLCDHRKNNWYGVDLEDTVNSASKLGLTTKQVRERLGSVACRP
jgi:hypothetical protein